MGDVLAEMFMQHPPENFFDDGVINQIHFQNRLRKSFGQKSDNLMHESGMPIYDFQDCRKWLAANQTQRVPKIYHSTGATHYFKGYGCDWGPWGVAPNFYRTLERTKRPFIGAWGHLGSINSDNNQHMIPWWWDPVLRLRKDQPMVAFANSSHNEDPGDSICNPNVVYPPGTPDMVKNAQCGFSGHWRGRMGGHLGWYPGTFKEFQDSLEVVVTLKAETLTTTWTDWIIEMPLTLFISTTDITPVYMSTFKGRPDSYYRFTNTLMNTGALEDSGLTLSDSLGRVTIKQTRITKFGNKITLAYSHPASGIETRGMDPWKKQEGIVCTPNPFSTSVNILVHNSTVPQFHSSTVKTEIRIFDVNGKLVNKQFNCGTAELRYCGTSYTWDAHNLPNGVYLVRATVGTRELKARLILLR
jgi:hypothetical protein